MCYLECNDSITTDMIIFTAGTYASAIWRSCLKSCCLIGTVVHVAACTRTTPPISLQFVTHDETSEEYRTLYRTQFSDVQEQLIWFGAACRSHKATWEMGVAFDMIDAVGLYDPDPTDGRPANIIKQLVDRFGVRVNAHASDGGATTSYDMVGCRIQDELLVMPTNVVSGFRYDIEGTAWTYYNRYRPDCGAASGTWQPRILWGAMDATGAIVDFYRVGFWKPTSPGAFTTHLDTKRCFYIDPGPLPDIKPGFKAADVLRQIEDRHRAMVRYHVPTDAFYPFSLFFQEKHLLDADFRNELSALLVGIDGLVADGKAEWKGLEELYYEWMAAPYGRASGFSLSADMEHAAYYP